MIFLRTKWPNFMQNFHILCICPKLDPMGVTKSNWWGIRKKVGVLTPLRGCRKIPELTGTQCCWPLTVGYWRWSKARAPNACASCVTLEPRFCGHVLPDHHVGSGQGLVCQTVWPEFRVLIAFIMVYGFQLIAPIMVTDSADILFY